MKKSVIFRVGLTNRRNLDDVAAHWRKSRSDTADAVVEDVNINDIANAIRQRYEMGQAVESVNRVGITLMIKQETITKLDDLSIRTGLPRETVLRLAIEAYYVKFTAAKANQVRNLAPTS